MINIAILAITFFTGLCVQGQPLQLLEQKVIDIRKVVDEPIITFYGRNELFVQKNNYILGQSGYIIWKEGSNLWIQKASNYYDSLAENVFDTLFKAVRLVNSDGYSFLIENMSSIQNQQLKPGLIKNTFDGIDSLTEVKYYPDDIAVIEVYHGTRKFTKEIKSSQLNDGIILNDDGSIRFKRESVNYNFNIRSAVYKFYSLLQASIYQLECEDAFHE